jgi:hypothetical protein
MLALAGVAVTAIAASIIVQVARSGGAPPARTATVADPVTDSAIAPRAGAPFDAAAAPFRPVMPPVRVTDVRLTDNVDSVTGEPGAPVDAFGAGDTVRLWFSFEAVDLSQPLTVVWLHEEKKVARLTAPLPGAASQMVFPLPELAVDRPGLYRVEIRSHRDVLAAETFEVTDI